MEVGEGRLIEALTKGDGGPFFTNPSPCHRTGQDSRSTAWGLVSFLARLEPHTSATPDADHVPPTLGLWAGEE